MSLYDAVSLAGSLILIVGILVLTYFATRWYARRMQSSGGGKYVKVVDKAVLGQGSALAVVEACGRHFLVGLSEKNIQMLCELEDFGSFADSLPQPEESSFQSVLRDVMERARDGFGKKRGGGGGA